MGSKVLGTVAQVGDVLNGQVIDEVILAVPAQPPSAIWKRSSTPVRNRGVRFRFMADVFDLEVARTRLVELDGIPLLTFDPVAQNEGMLLAKRFMDLLLVLAAMPGCGAGDGLGGPRHQA